MIAILIIVSLLVFAGLLYLSIYLYKRLIEIRSKQEDEEVK